MNKELVVHNNPTSVISENLRMIRTNIQFATSGRGGKTILITSSAPGEGKSFISSNLAISFSQLKKKTIIIDCDLRRGRLHRLFNLKNEFGLTTILRSNEISNSSDYITKSGIPNLDILTRGDIPINPSELLNTECIDMLLKTLKDEYDYIILDGVPTTGLSDSIILAKKVDMVVIVSALKTASKELLKNTKKSLESVNANIVGVVVNKVPRTNGAYYNYK